jgi:hypothetical protein
MDIFYIKNYDSNADVETKVTKFISDFETRYVCDVCPIIKLNPVGLKSLSLIYCQVSLPFCPV